MWNHQRWGRCLMSRLQPQPSVYSRGVKSMYKKKLQISVTGLNWVKTITNKKKKRKEKSLGMCIVRWVDWQTGKKNYKNLYLSFFAIKLEQLPHCCIRDLVLHVVWRYFWRRRSCKQSLKSELDDFPQILLLKPRPHLHTSKRRCKAVAVPLACRRLLPMCLAFQTN